MRLRWDGECEEKVGENVDKKGGGAFVITAAAKCVNEKRWKGGNVEMGPKDEGGRKCCRAEERGRGARERQGRQ